MAAGVSLFRRNLDDADHSLLTFDRHTQDVGRNIDKLSGRLGLFIDLAATLGPALIPTAAAAVPILAGLTNQLGFAVIGAGSAVLAFHGVGDALKAFNAQASAPSAANLEKMHEAMAKLGPAGRDFVRELHAMGPQLKGLQDAAQAGLFPGMTEGIDSLLTRLPQAKRIISEVTDTLGGLLSDAGDSLAGPKWDQFFNMLESEARPTLQALGESIGQVTRGLAELWMAFAPLNRDFSKSMLDASKDFADWADNLSHTQGFADFMAYLDETGPKVAATLGSMGSALLNVVEAAAPLGGPALAAIKAFSEAISTVANSDIGTPLLAAVAMWRAYALAMGVVEKAQLRMNAAQKAQAGGASGGIFGSANTLKSQLGELRAMPAAFKGAASAQEALTLAQREAGLVTSRYNGQLRAMNTVTATGFKPSITSFGRLSDSLSKVEMANYGVMTATDKAKAAEAERSRVTRAGAAGLAKTAAGAAALGVAMTGVGDGIGLSNTAMIGMTGFMVGGGLGAAFGAAIGATIDLAHANDDLEAAVSSAHLAMRAGDMDALTAAYERMAKAAEKVHGFDVASGDRPSFGQAFSLNPKTALNNIKGAFSGETKQTKSELATAHGGLSGAAAFDATKGLVATSKLAAQGFHLTAAAAREASMSVEQFAGAIKGANAALSRQGTLDAYRSSLLDLKDSLKENGKTLATNTREGLANRASLRAIASSALQAAGEIQNFGRRTKFLQQARKDFISAATAAGMTRAAAKSLASQLGLVDRIHAKPRVDLQGGGAALSTAAQVSAALSRIPRNVYSTIHVTRSGAIGGAGHSTIQARGNLYYASGGMDVANRHMPELAGPGMTRVWREPETQGEAYIPLADDDRRPRAQQIAAETVSMLGGTAYFAGGGIQHFARGGNHDGNHHPLNHHLHELELAVRSSTKAINREKSARDALVSKRNDLSGTVRDSFLTDPFGGSNVWAAGGGAGGSIGILKADIAKANAFKSSLAQLKKNGLDGDALAAIAATGDIGKAQALLSSGKAGVGQFGSLFNQRAKAAAAVGSFAGTAAYGHQIAVQNHELKVHSAHLKHIEAELKHIRKEAGGHAKATGDHVGNKINHAAGHAKRGKRG